MAIGHLTKVVSLIPAYGEVYLIQHYGKKFVSDWHNRSVVFSVYSGFLHQ